jgi:ribose 1,5-bisphosphokinase
MTARCALYFTPEPASPWGRFGSAWLGRCAASGVTIGQPSIAGVAAAELAALTESPRRYGFHATLKAPFRPRADAPQDAIIAALDSFCASRVAFRIPRLQVAMLDDFLAGTLAAPDARISELAAACVTEFDRFRAPLDAAELARRRALPLTDREDALLRRWGYPHVLDAYRFHFSLSGRLRGAHPDLVAALQRAAREALDALALEPLVFDSVCLFEEPALGAALRIIHRARFARRGRLVYVVGPSGAGKDSVLQWVRSQLPDGSQIRFARRAITRPAIAGDEGHLPVSRAQFDRMLDCGEFALHWSAHGHCYGIGREIADWLASGQTVVVNGSREFLPQALVRYPQLEAVHVDAQAGALRARLAGRAREGAAEARERLARAIALSGEARSCALLLDNDGPIERAGTRFLEYLLRYDA